MLEEESLHSLEYVLAALVPADTVVVFWIEHDIEVLIGFEQFLHELDRILEQNIIVLHSVDQKKIPLKPFSEVNRRCLLVEVLFLVLVSVYVFVAYDLFIFFQLFLYLLLFFLLLFRIGWKVEPLACIPLVVIPPLIYGRYRNARLEDVRRRQHHHVGQKTAVTPPPESQPLAIHEIERFEVFRGADRLPDVNDAYLVEVARVEILAVSIARPEIHRHDHVSRARGSAE